MPLKSLSKVSVGASGFNRLPNGFKRSSKLTQTMPIDGDTIQTHSGTANIGVTISATASATAFQIYLGTASCQVNLSASAAGINTNTTVPDETVNGNNMTLFNGPLFTSDSAVGSRATDFDGTNDYALFSSTYQSVLRSSFSFSLWARLPDGDASFIRLLMNYPHGDSSTPDYLQFYTQSGLLKAYYRAGGVALSVNQTTGALGNGDSGWLHLVLVGIRTSSTDHTLKIYKNGSEVASNQASGGGTIDFDDFTTTEKIAIGRQSSSSGSQIYHDYKIDDVSIWSKSLSSTEVSNLYNSGSGSSLTGSSDLEGWWKMGDHSVVPITHSGTATFSVAITTSANGDLLELHSGTASCQVNLSASASGSSVTPATYSNNYSIDLDGTNDWVDASSFDPYDEIGTGDFTISLWVKPDAVAGMIPFAFLDGSSNDNGQCRLNLLSNNLWRISWKPSGGTNLNAVSTVTWSTGSWYHVVVTRSGQQCYVYVNNSEVISVNASQVAHGFVNNGEFNIGRYRQSYNGGWFNGHIDEFGIWDEVLTSAERTAIYNSGTPINLASDSGNYASSSNLIGYWRFEENSGTSIADSSTNSNAITLTNGPTFSTDVPVGYTNNYSLEFDGTNDHLSTNLVTNTYSLKNGFTASLWVKLDDVSTTQDFFGRYGNSTARFYFGITGSNVRAAIGTSFDTSTLSHGMSTGTWYHVAYTFSGGSSGTFTYYLNGSSVGTISFTWTSDSGSYEPMHIGGLKNGSNLHQNPTNGKLDEFALYNSTLSASDITAIYNSGAPADQSSDSNLVAYWRMEENTGTTVADSSSNSNTATLTNGPTFNTDTPS